MVGVLPIEDEFKENKLRWFGCIQRRPAWATVKENDKITLIEMPWVGLVNMRCNNRKYMSLANLLDYMALDKHKIHVANHD